MACSPGLQYPGNPYYVTDGKELYNAKDPKKAAALLKEAGYKGEELVIITNSSYQSMYKAAQIVSEQLKAVGFKVRVDVFDWATAMNRRSDKDAWNLWFTGQGSGPSVGPFSAMKDVVSPQKNQVVADPELDKLYAELVSGATVEARKATFGKFQARVYDQVHFLKFGDLYRKQAARVQRQGLRALPHPAPVERLGRWPGALNARPASRSLERRASHRAHARMIQFILRRLLVALPVLLLVSLISASIMQLVPGDPAAVIAGQNASDAEIAQIREQLGLNRPFPVKLAAWYARPGARRPGQLDPAEPPGHAGDRRAGAGDAGPGRLRAVAHRGHRLAVRHRRGRARQYLGRPGGADPRADRRLGAEFLAQPDADRAVRRDARLAAGRRLRARSPTTRSAGCAA